MNRRKEAEKDAVAFGWMNKDGALFWPSPVTAMQRRAKGLGSGPGFLRNIVGPKASGLK
jgi:hypothetical protein